MNRTITVNVVKEFARQDSQNGGIQGSGNVDHLRLRFSEDWDGYAKTCVFWDANGENPVKVIVGADKLEDMTKDPRTYIIDIPPEPLAVEGTYTVVIDGYLDGKRGRSETIRLKSNGAQIADDAGEPADPTPSQAEQLQQEIEKIIPNIQAVATEAKSWAVGGTGSRDGEDTDNAKYYAKQSEKSAQESAQGMENISQQVEAAKGYAESAKTESLHAANRAQSASESERNALESSESAKTAESNAKISEQSSAESARQSEEARQAIENMTASAVSVGPDAEPYVKKTSYGGVVNLEFGLRDGEPGPPGYTVPADGLYAFHIDKNGDLIITYTGDEVPPFSIDQNGDLIYTLGGNEVSIGHVADIGAQEAAVEAKEAAIQAEAQAQSAADAAQQAGQAKTAAEAAAGSAEQSAQEAKAAAAVIPTPTKDDARKVPTVNAAGDGYELVQLSGDRKYKLIATVTVEEVVSQLFYDFGIKTDDMWVYVNAGNTDGSLPVSPRIGMRIGNRGSGVLANGTDFLKYNWFHICHFGGDLFFASISKGNIDMKSYYGSQYSKGCFTIQNFSDYLPNARQFDTLWVLGEFPVGTVYEIYIPEEYE